jgi:hypothetical protein
MNSRRFIGLPQDQGSPTEYSKVRTVHRSKSGPLMSEWVIQDRCGRSHASMYVRFCPKADKRADVLGRPLCADFVAKVIDGFRSK